MPVDFSGMSSASRGQCFSLAAPMCQVDFPGPIPTSPISPAFSGPWLSLAAPMCHVDFRGQTPTNPISSAFSVQCFPLLHPCAVRKKNNLPACPAGFR